MRKGKIAKKKALQGREMTKKETSKAAEKIVGGQLSLLENCKPESTQNSFIKNGYMQIAEFRSSSVALFCSYKYKLY